MAATRDDYCKQLKIELGLDDDHVDVHFNSAGVLIIELNGSSKINPRLNQFKLDYSGPLDLIVHR